MFDTVVKYLDGYWRSHVKSWTNEERRKWFAYGAKDMNELIEDKFSSDTESSELEGISKSDAKTAYEKLQAIRIKIAIIAGFRHDIRAQFAVGETNDDRNEIDFMRHAASRCNFLADRLFSVANFINGKSKS